MIREMKAWILSQPDKLEQLYSHRKKHSIMMKDDSDLVGVHPEYIVKPSRLIKQLLPKYSGVPYGKLKNAHEMIRILSVDDLRAVFEDLDRLFNVLLTKLPTTIQTTKTI
jgi:hypothetical protein